MNSKKIYQSFYTNSGSIVRYMLRMLSIEPGQRLLEPCAGEGVFIDGLNGSLDNILVDLYELDPRAVACLQTKYMQYDNVKVMHEDALTSDTLEFYSRSGGIYDRVIANPPYGAWQDHSKRKLLKKIYPGFYVKETYTLFLFRCLQLLKEGGILVFITPDTYLNLHMHTKLRECLLLNTRIKEIALFPSSFFPEVNFGYANLSIITLQKNADRENNLANEFKVITGFKNVSDLGHSKKHLNTYSFSQQNVYSNIDYALFVSDNSLVTQAINESRQRIGDVADCVTGFYSGNDRKFLKKYSEKVRYGSKYPVVRQEEISSDYLQSPNLLDGIEGARFFIPIVKGGNTKYFKPDMWFIDWSAEAVEIYKTHKKSRFQNADYYFRLGIGVPMVSSSQITAALIEDKIFDQSIVGVFPKQKEMTYYLLAFFNSPTCNKLIRTINPTANNSANYIKKIPFIRPQETMFKKINILAREIVNNLKNYGMYSSQKEVKLNAYIEEVYGF